MNYLLKQNTFFDIWSPKLTIPVPTLDIVIFTIYEGKLSVLLLKNSDGVHALPGGIVARGFDLEKNCDHILEKKVGIQVPYKEQLYTFSSPNRDPRGETLSVTYLALLGAHQFISQLDFTKIAIIEYSKIQEQNQIPLAYDHREIVEYAQQRLRWKLEYTNIAKDMLNTHFRIGELQRVYEIILGKEIDKRNFQKKLFKLGMLEETGEKDRSTNRPATLYRFVDKELKQYEVL